VRGHFEVLSGQQHPRFLLGGMALKAPDYSGSQNSRIQIVHFRILSQNSKLDRLQDTTSENTLESQKFHTSPICNLTSTSGGTTPLSICRTHSASRMSINRWCNKIAQQPPPGGGKPDNKILKKILLEVALYKTSKCRGIIKEEYSPSGLTYTEKPRLCDSLGRRKISRYCANIGKEDIT
jgi:hypothetical protein